MIASKAGWTRKNPRSHYVSVNDHESDEERNCQDTT